MQEIQEARKALNGRNWPETSALWERLSDSMGLTLIRVKSCDKIPDEGKGWQEIEHRSYQSIGFKSEDNAGVVTSYQSGIIVLDVDEQIAFTKACKANNWIVPETFTVKTGKGYHYYYKRPDDHKEYRNRSKKAEGWDIRASGGYVVAPCSIHPSGSIYTVIDYREFTAAPEWLLHKALGEEGYKKVNRKCRSVQRKGKTVSQYDLPDVDLNALQVSDYVKTLIIEGAEDGERSELVFSVIKALLQAGCEPYEIVSIFMSYPIGEKAWEKDDPEGWVYDDIDRIIAKTEGFDQIDTSHDQFSKRTIPIPDIKELKAEYRKLVEYSHRDLIETLRGYGNVTSESQDQALHALLHAYAALAQGKIGGRIAVPLPTGLGKTTSISAFLGRAFSMGLLGRERGNFTVAIAASKVDQLCDLHKALVKSGIPEKYISLVHSYTYRPEVQRDTDGNLPNGYAALPTSIDKNRPILLLSHNKVKNGPEHAFDDSLKRRTFVIWDESLISTDTRALNVKSLGLALSTYAFVLDDLNGQAKNGDSFFDQTKLEVANSTMAHLGKSFAYIKEEISSQNHGRSKEVVRFPHANEMTMKEMLLSIDWVAQTQELEEARGLILYLKELLRVTQYDTSVHLGKNDKTTVVRFDVVVPDSLKNMVILDASARINTLMMLDQTIHLPGNLPELHLAYTGTVFQRIDHPAGRTNVQAELENTEKNLMPCITEIIKSHHRESVLIFTFKHRPGELHHREVIEKYLEENGIDTHEQINGNPRFNWLTHGNETASNRYTHCSVAIFVGLMHKPREISLSETVAQMRDHTITVSEKLLTQVIRGMLSQAIHQGANRTASRTIENDQAKPVSIYYTYPNDSLVPFLEVVLPDARFTVYESDVMSPRTLMWKVRKAVIEFLKGLTSDVDKVSVKVINLNVPETLEVGCATCKRVINSIIDDSGILWTRSGRSLVRV